MPANRSASFRYEPPGRGTEVEPSREQPTQPPQPREVEQPKQPPGFRPPGRGDEVEQPKRPPNVEPPREDSPPEREE